MLHGAKSFAEEYMYFSSGINDIPFLSLLLVLYAKIISIILMMAMLAPNVARWLAWSASKIKKASGSEKIFAFAP